MTERRAMTVLIGGATVAIFALFLPFLGAPFEYDDKVEIVLNQVIRHPGDVREMVAYNPFRVLLLYTFAADIWAWGLLTPQPYRLENIAIKNGRGCGAGGIGLRLEGNQNRYYPGRNTINASNITIEKIWMGSYPMAKRMPNSRVRSITLTKMVLKMPAATRSAMRISITTAPPSFMAINPLSSGWI